MRYISTRGKTVSVTGAEAILRGLAPDGGLYVPENIPSLPADFHTRLAPMAYSKRAAYALSLFLPEFGDLDNLCEEAYTRFDGSPAPLVQYGEGNPYFLELWHGPTCAFKDMALQVLPHLVSKAKLLTGEKRDIYILTATSGDTGVAALEGFRDIPGTKVLVFYPEQGVSTVQQLQMVTQAGNNVGVCAVKGDFDDAQTGVKQIFTQHIENGSFILSSANSINLGRLLPQIAYYVSVYTDYIAENPNGQPPDIYVPTGNFGNILAALYAKRMGVPLGRLVCVSNKNNVLTDVIKSGTYNRNRTLYQTTSPSMDILVSSNFERAIYLLSGCDAEYTANCMEILAKTGTYTLRPSTADALSAEMDAFWFDDAQAADCIRTVYQETGRVIDPHTATAAAAAWGKSCIVVSTAHPAKFPEAVLGALGKTGNLDQFTEIPAPLLGLEQKPRRFNASVSPKDMPDFVREFFA